MDPTHGLVGWYLEFNVMDSLIHGLKCVLCRYLSMRRHKVSEHSLCATIPGLQNDKDHYLGGVFLCCLYYLPVPPEVPSFFLPLDLGFCVSVFRQFATKISCLTTSIKGRRYLLSLGHAQGKSEGTRRLKSKWRA